MHLERILLDVEVQRDFFSPGGSCYAPQAAVAARNVRRLFAWARRSGIPVISTVLRVRRGERGPLAPVPHCLDGSEGERRIPGTVLPRCVDLGIRNSTDLPGDLFERYRQVIFEKRYTDIFRHARAERLLTELDGGTFVVCGAGSAGGIVEAVVGLRQRSFKVILAADAILDLNDPRAEYAWLRMVAKGAVPLSTGEIVVSAGAARPARPIARPGRPHRCRDRALTG
jgi:nicotinamidase-related amidase